MREREVHAKCSTRGAGFGAVAAALFVSSCLGVNGVRADAWPKWRGPNADGISKETGLLEEWPNTFRPLWTAENVGQGFAGPVARDGRAYCFTLIDNRDTLACYDAASGKVIWSESYDGGWTGNYPGTRATPVIEGERIYTYGGGSDLVARELKTGKMLWRLNVLKETRASSLSWAQASNPLIDGNVIYLQNGMGGRVAVGVDKNTGQLVWRAQVQASGSYSHPIMADVQGRKQLIVFASEGPIGIDPANGRTIWKQEWGNSTQVSASDPIYRDGYLFVTSAYGKGSVMFQITPKGAKKNWENPEVESRFQPAILDGDYLYVNSEGTLKCLKWPQRNIVWTTRRQDTNLLGLGGSILRFGKDRMILLSQSGRLTLARVSPQGFEQLASVPDVVEGSEVWAAPAVSDGKLFLKGQDELVCIDIKAK